MPKTSKLSFMIEPELEDIFRSMATKRGVSVSLYLRSMVIDEIQINGLLPADLALGMFKGTNTLEN